MNKLQLSFAIAAIAVAPALSGQTQTFTGVLLDANCSEIRNMSSTTGTGTIGADGGIQDSSGIARPGAPGPGGAAGDPIAGTGPATDGQKAAGKPSDETAAGGRATAGAGTLSPQVRNCMATSNTSSYALYSEGRIIQLDPESNSQIQKHLQSESQSGDRTRTGAPAPMHVQVKGQLQLKVTSVQPMRGSGRNP